MAAGDSLRIVLNTGNGWDDFLQPQPGFGVAYDNVTHSTHVTYFLEVDVAPSANFLTSPLTPRVRRLAYNGLTASHIKTSIGSSFANATGTTYSFNDVTKPTLANTIPFTGQLNQSVTGDIVLTFSEPVKALDGTISIFDAQLKQFVATLKAVEPLGVFGTTFTFKTNYIHPVTTLLTNYLSAKTRYYITIPKVDPDVTQGFVDTSNNPFDGINNYSFNFRTASDIPPVVTNAAQFNDVTLHGGTLSIGLDQPGKVLYMIVESPSVAPGSIDEIAGSSTYTGGTVVTRGALDIIQTSVYQYGFVEATFVNNANYDIYMYAQNDAAPPVTTGILPSITFTATNPPGIGIIVQAPTINICPGGIPADIPAHFTC